MRALWSSRQNCSHNVSQKLQRTFKSSGGSPSEGHNPPRGSSRKFASQRVLRGLCGGLFEGSAGSPRGSAGLRGSAGFSEGSDPMLVTLGNCWSRGASGGCLQGVQILREKRLVSLHRVSPW